MSTVLLGALTAAALLVMGSDARAATVSNPFGSLTVDFTNADATPEFVEWTSDGSTYRFSGDVTCGTGMSAPEPGICTVAATSVTGTVTASDSGGGTDQTLSLRQTPSASFTIPSFLVEAGIEETRLAGNLDLDGSTATFRIKSPAVLAASTTITSNGTSADVEFWEPLDALNGVTPAPSLAVRADELQFYKDVGATDPLMDLTWTTPGVFASNRRVTFGSDRDPPGIVTSNTLTVLGDVSLAPTEASQTRFQTNLSVDARSLDIDALRWAGANAATLTIDVDATSRIRGDIENRTNATNNTGLAITKLGAGALSIESTSTSTGTMRVDAGTVIAANALALGQEQTGGVPKSNGPTYVASGATLALSNSITTRTDELIRVLTGGTLASTSGSNVASTATFEGDALLDAAATSSLELAGAIGGGRNVVKTGDGRVILPVANTYTGTTTVSDGTLAIEHTSGLGGTSGVTVADGASLDLVANGSYAVGGAATNVPISIAGAGASTGIGALHASGATGATLSGTGSLAFAADAALSAAPSSTLSINMTVTATGREVGTVGSGTVEFTTPVSAGSVDASGPISVGSITTTGTQTYAAGLTINSLPATLQATGITANTIAQGLFAAGTLTFDVSGPSAVTGAITKSAAGPMGIVKGGTGTLTMGGSSTYEGTTTINAGTLAITNAGALGSPNVDPSLNSTTTVASGATLALSGGLAVSEPITISGGGVGNGGALRNASGTNELSGTITLGAGATIGVDAGLLRLTTSWDNDAIKDGAGTSFTKVGVGSLEVRYRATYSGGTTVADGTVIVTQPNGLGTGAVQVQDGAAVILDNDGNGLAGGVANAFTIAGSGPSGAGALVADDGNGNASPASATGTITLSADATVGSGAADTLEVATITGAGHALTVPSGAAVRLTTSPSGLASLRVDGTVTSEVDVTPTAVALGAAGVLALDDAAAGTTISASTLSAALDGTSAGAHSQIDVVGTVDLGGAALDLTVGYAPRLGDVITLVDNDGVDAVVGTFDGLAEGGLLVTGGTGWRISYTGGTGNDVTLSARLAPDAPRSAAAAAGDATVTVSWQAPASDGGETVGAYTVTGSPAGSCTTTATTCTITGLANGTTYSFTVTATNAVGSSARSAAVGATPITIPTAPSGATATAGLLRATVSWTAPSSNGGSAITSYTATANPGGKTCTATTTSCTIAGLQNTTAYTFTVTATNAAGTSPASTATNTTRPYKKLKMKKPRARGTRIASAVRVTGAATITQTIRTTTNRKACAKRIRATKKKTYTVTCPLNRATRNALKKRRQTLTVTTTVFTKKGATFAVTHTVRVNKTRRR